MRLIPPLPPPCILRPASLLAPLLICIPAVLSQSTDDTLNASAASFLSLPESFHTAVSVMVRLFSSFSLLFSSFVVAAFFVVPRLRYEYNARFVLLLACSDLLHSLLLIIGPLSLASSPSSLLFPALTPADSPSEWCSAHSSLLLYASLVSLSWTSVIAINHFMVVYYSASILQLRRYQLAQHISAWLLPLLLVLLVLLLPSSDAALASPLCWFGMADARLAYPSSAWLLLLPQLLNCTLLSFCYILALRYGLRLTTEVVAKQNKETSQAAAAFADGLPASQKASSAAASQVDRAVLSDKYHQMKRKVSLYLLCAFSLTFPLLLSSLSLLPSTSLPADYLSFLFLLQAIVGSSQGLFHSVVYGWNLRLFYHIYPPASHPPFITALLDFLRLPPPPPSLSPMASPPFANASRRIHPSVLGATLPATSPYLPSRAVSTIGRGSWRGSSVMMAQMGGGHSGSGRMPMRYIGSAVQGVSGGGNEEDDSGSRGSMHVTPVLTSGILLSPPAADAADMRFCTISPDGSSESISPFVSRNAPSSLGANGGDRRFSVTTTLANLPAAAMEGGSFSAPYPHSCTSSPVLTARGEPLPTHLQPLTNFSSYSNPQSALPWIPSLLLPPHHTLPVPALTTPGGLAPVRSLRTGSSFSSSSRASVSFLSPTHVAPLTPRSDGSGGRGEVVDATGGLRVTVSGWEGGSTAGSGLTARRSSQEEIKELETLREEDEKDSEDNTTPVTAEPPHRSSLHCSSTNPLSLTSPSASAPSATCNEQSRGSVIVSIHPVLSPSTGSHSSSSPSASTANTPPSTQHPTGTRYSFSLPSLGNRASPSTPSSSRSSPHAGTRNMPAGYSPRPSTFDRRPLRVNPAPPTTASARVSPRTSGGPEPASNSVQVGMEAAGVKRPKLTSRQSLPLTVEAMSVELRTGVSTDSRMAMRRQSEPTVMQ